MRTIHRIPLKNLAALAECIEGVDMRRVSYYRNRLIAGDEIEPILVSPQNRLGYFVISDGHHRTLAHFLNGCDVILGEVDPCAPISKLSWRWPRVAPVSQTYELMKLS